MENLGTAEGRPEIKKHKIILMLKNGIDEKQISLDLKTSIKTIKKCMEDLKKSLN